MKRKPSVLSIKDKQIIISHLDKGEKETNLALGFGISKQQNPDIRKNNSQANSEPEQQHSVKSMVKILQHVQEVGNTDSLNAHDLEDWLNLDNVLPTTEQMSDEQPLAIVTGHSNENESSDEEDDGPEEKQVSNSEQNVLKSACPGWKNRTMLTLLKSCNFAVRWTSPRDLIIRLKSKLVWFTFLEITNRLSFINSVHEYRGSS